MKFCVFESKKCKKKVKNERKIGKFYCFQGFGIRGGTSCIFLSVYCIPLQKTENRRILGCYRYHLDTKRRLKFRKFGPFVHLNQESLDVR